MALTKYASLESAEVLELKSSPERSKTASLRTLSDFHDYRTEDGYLYARIRAISSRVNKNHDGWPTVELAGGPEDWEKISSQHTASEGFTVEASKGKKYGFSTFLGKPHFVDHHNSNPERARGVVVDAKFNVLDQKTASSDDYWSGDNVDAEHNPPSEVELLIEIDAKSFPKLAKAIVDGDIDGFSMGCDVDYSKCSHCGHEASSPDEYCSHIQAKGAEFDFTSSEGKVSSKKSYENCYGIKFFEISAVFDPADETALTREIRAEGRESKTAALPFEQPDPVKHSPSPDEIMAHARKIVLDNPGMQLGEAMTIASQELSNRFNIAPDQVQGGDGATLPEPKLKEFAPVPNELPIGGVGITPRYQGSHEASVKTAQPDEPQVDHTKAPEDVDTMREEKICPLCGSDIDDGKCGVCGYEEPPESLQNPDLTKALDADQGQQDGQELSIPPDNPQELTTPEGEPGLLPGSPLSARNPKPASTLSSEMRWAPTIPELRLAAPKPQGDEPNETVTSDQTTPVTSAFRTAQDMIQAAKRNHKENTMSDQNKVAAEPADASGKAKKNVDVTGVGGVDDASAEAASKADTQTDVEGKGGVLQDSNAEASKADSTESLPSEKDNAGFQPGGETGPETQTWDNSNEPESAVTDKAFPTAANHGTQPADPVGKAQDRIDVEQPPHDQIGDKTKTWSGTDGNGVTKQLDPVTNVPTQSGGVKASGYVSLAALKLAEAEVSLGIISEDDKFNRLAELGDTPEDQIVAEHRALAKVKTAGLTRTASKGGAGRVPSFKRIASEETPAPQPVDDALLDSSLFSR